MNTDDPGFFKTDLDSEYLKLYQLGVNVGYLKKIAKTSIEMAFKDDKGKNEFLAFFDK